MSNPKGKLIAIGGAEHKGTELEADGFTAIISIFLNLAFFAGWWKKPAALSRIEVITTASMIPYEVGENYLNAFGKIGCTNIGVDAYPHPAGCDE